MIEGLTKVFYPEASNTVIFVIMAIVLLIKPAGLFGNGSSCAMAATSRRPCPRVPRRVARGAARMRDRDSS